jgi:hypothetical protein
MADETVVMLRSQGLTPGVSARAWAPLRRPFFQNDIVVIPSSRTCLASKMLNVSYLTLFEIIKGTPFCPSCVIRPASRHGPIPRERTAAPVPICTTKRSAVEVIVGHGELFQAVTPIASVVAFDVAGFGETRRNATSIEISDSEDLELGYPIISKTSRLRELSMVDGNGECHPRRSSIYHPQSKNYTSGV